MAKPQGGGSRRRAQQERAACCSSDKATVDILQDCPSSSDEDDQSMVIADRENTLPSPPHVSDVGANKKGRQHRQQQQEHHQQHHHHHASPSSCQSNATRHLCAGCSEPYPQPQEEDHSKQGALLTPPPPPGKRWSAASCVLATTETTPPSKRLKISLPRLSLLVGPKELQQEIFQHLTVTCWLLLAQVCKSLSQRAEEVLRTRLTTVESASLGLATLQPRPSVQSSRNLINIVLSRAQQLRVVQVEQVFNNALLRTLAKSLGAADAAAGARAGAGAGAGAPPSPSRKGGKSRGGASLCKLRSLSLPKCEDVTDDGLLALAAAPYIRKLLHLDLEQCVNVGCRGLSALARAVPNLELLHLNGCSLVNDEALQTCVALCPRLVSINAECTSVGNAAVCTIAEQCPNLRELCLRGNMAVQDSGVLALARGCGKYLRWLGLPGCHHLGAAAFEAIGRSMPRLRYVDVEDVPAFGDAAAARIAEGCRELEFIATDQCYQLTDIGVSVLSSSLSSTLYEVMHNGCTALTDDALISLARNAPKLTYLGIEGCVRITDRGLAALGTHSASLHTVGLNHLPLISDEGVSRLVQGCQELKVLYLNSTALTNVGLQAIGQCLPDLHKLGLSSCAGITNSGLATLAAALRSLTHIWVDLAPQIDGQAVCHLFCSRCQVCYSARLNPTPAEEGVENEAEAQLDVGAMPATQQDEYEHDTRSHAEEQGLDEEAQPPPTESHSHPHYPQAVSGGGAVDLEGGGESEMDEASDEASVTAEDHEEESENEDEKENEKPNEEEDEEADEEEADVGLVLHSSRGRRGGFDGSDAAAGQASNRASSSTPRALEPELQSLDIGEEGIEENGGGALEASSTAEQQPEQQQQQQQSGGGGRAPLDLLASVARGLPLMPIDLGENR